MEIQNISIKDAEKLAENNKDNPDFIILDVRTKEENSECKFKNSINIDIFLPDFIHKLNELGRDKTYLVHCRSGVRSIEAIQAMTKLGFIKIYHSEKGIDC